MTLVSCATLASPVIALGEPTPIVLKLAHISAQGGMLDQRAQKFAELVASKTDGRVRVEVYPAQQLGTIQEILQGLSKGTIDMGQESESFMDVYEKDFSVYWAPFVFSREEFKYSAYLKELREQVRKKRGIRTLPGLAFRPAFHLWTKSQPVPTPNDLKGIKLRVWESKTLGETWKGLGATPILMPWGEVGAALSQGVVDGLFQNTVQVRDEKLYEKLKYCTFLNFVKVYDVTWVNDKRFSSLPANVQQALNDSAQEAADWFVAAGQAMDEQARTECGRAGVTFFDPDLEPWVRGAALVHHNLEKSGVWSKGLLMKLGKAY
jgi:TRAP-type C4-dicarboxylate transport system substrate-binding protein